MSVGKVMVTPTFLNVGQDAKCFLSDLKVTGYTAPTKNSKGKWQGGCGGGKFMATKLTTSGTAAANYYWIDNGTVGPGWFADALGTAIDGGAESVELPVGQALWTQGSAYKIVPAGAVNTQDVAFLTVAVGKVAVGNSSPVELTLGDLTVTGYTAPTKNSKGKWQGGCGGGKFMVTKLTTSGTADANYYWIDNGTVGPGWFADALGAAIEGGATTVKIPAGLGLWTQGSGYTLNIPAPEL